MDMIDDEADRALQSVWRIALDKYAKLEVWQLCVLLDMVGQSSLVEHLKL